MTRDRRPPGFLVTLALWLFGLGTWSAFWFAVAVMMGGRP